MSENLVKLYRDLEASEKIRVRRQVEEIFFETSSKKEFVSDEERRIFLYKYLGYYFEHFPEWIWVAMDQDVLGYIAAAPTSSQEDLFLIQPHMLKFKDLFDQYPAHLHINLTHRAQGQGLGRQLVNALERELKGLKIQGLHIMTGTQAQNRHFYSKLGFHQEVARDSILFMGKRWG